MDFDLDLEVDVDTRVEAGLSDVVSGYGAFAVEDSG